MQKKKKQKNYIESSVLDFWKDLRKQNF